jgi:integrase
MELVWNFMASVTRDPRSPKGVWYARYTLADGRRACRSTGKYKKAEAEIICDAWQAAENGVLNGGLTEQRIREILNETLQRLGINPVQEISIAVWLADWLKSCKGSIKESTLVGYEQAVRDFSKFLSEVRLNHSIKTITLADINAFKDHLLAEGRSPSTTNKLIKKYLNTPLQLAWKLGKIPFNPIAGFKTLKVESATKGRFTPEQVSKLLKACAQDEDWRGAILFAYGSGARLQDVANLLWSNVDTVNGVVQFKQRKSTKGAKATIGIHADFAEWLAASARAGDKLDGPVFPSLANRPGGGPHGLCKAFERIMDRAGIKSGLIKERSPRGKGRSVRALSFHSLRHGVASAVFNSEALKEVTRRVTAHAPDGSLDRYIHHDLEVLKAVVTLIPRVPK